MDESCEILCSTPPEIQEAARAATLDLLPEKSRQNYEIVYNRFLNWRRTNNTTSFSENTLLVYFKELTKKYKSSTMWTHYSMLKSTLNIKHGIDIEPYAKLRALLKRHSEGYQPKKSEAFTGEEINQFINEAPDIKYLATKVALIMGVMGACRAHELYAMKIEDLKFFEGCIQVFVPHTKTKVPRNFSVTGIFYGIVKKYMDLRPPNASNKFFLNFQYGKCTKQIIGINKFGAMGKEIAKFLNIPNPDRYTGHCLRRSSATLCANGGATMTALKRHRGWKSNSVAEGYIADSKKNKMDTAKKILTQINPSNSCTSTYNTDSYSYASTGITNSCTSTNVSNLRVSTVNDNNLCITNSTSDVNFDISATPSINFTNCSNITINFGSK